MHNLAHKISPPHDLTHRKLHYQLIESNAITNLPPVQNSHIISIHLLILLCTVSSVNFSAVLRHTFT